MFETVNFTRYSDIYIDDSLTSETRRGKFVPLEVVSSSFGSDAETMRNADIEIVIHGYTSILFPPLNSDFSTEYAISPQGFFLCDHRKGYYTRRENYHSYMLCYTIGGSGILEYEGKTHHLAAQDVFWIDCRKHQYYYTDTAWNHADLHFCGPFADVLYEEFQKNGSPVFPCGSENTMIRRLEELARTWDTPQAYSALHISNKISDVLSYLLTLSKSGQFTEVQLGAFVQIIKYIEQHFSEPLSLDILAKEASMSKYHFSRLFKIHTGLSPMQYVIRLRITRARSMLESSALTIRQIAFNVGFSDINNFINQFKKMEGMTPSEYKSNFRIRQK